ncbi:hypothetical protein PG990_012261 [Apiospora arundinis]
MASNNSQSAGNSKNPGDNVTKSADLNHNPQRVYTKVLRGVEVAKKQLQKTAYTVLSQADQNVINAAVKVELKVNIEKDQKDMPAGTKLDYETLVDGVIRKVFSNNLGLFKANQDDNPGVDELMNWTG